MITQPTEQFFKDGLWGWDGTQWRKLPMLFGCSERWVEDLGDTDTAAADYSKLSTAVPTGYVYVVQSLSIRNQTGNRGITMLHVTNGAVWCPLGADPTPVTSIPLTYVGGLVLTEGDQVRVWMSSCALHDFVEAAVWGYKMAVT